MHEMNKMTIVVTHILGKSSAILHADGLTLFEAIRSSDSNATISFADITHCTTAFKRIDWKSYDH
ncbi:hypothetical protein [Dawidia cretensis]|nr:hypothetical protein [Dawidia cretensis]